MAGLMFGSVGRYKRAFIYTLHLAGISCWFKIFSEHYYELRASDGPSMFPTIHFRGDWLLISKHYKHGRDVEFGDIIVFKKPHGFHSEVAKRVVGLPGDYVLRNPPLNGETAVEEDAQMIQVPEAHVWVSGDDAPWSVDSKDYGPVPMGLIIGKALGRVWYPFNYERFISPLKLVTPAES